MKILVTGGTGLLGRNIILLLLKKGHEIVLLLRNPHKFNLKDEKIRIVKGDVLEILDIEKAIAGCDVVIHAAADTVQHHRSIDDYKVNTLGTKNILYACKKKKIQKVIHVGSAGYFGYGTLENPGEEINPIRYPSNKSYYLLSKLQAQKLVQDYSRSGHIVTISPTFMIGSLDFGPSSGKIILMGLKKFIFCPPGGKNFVHVEDVATACINAIDYGKSGENYIIGNENLSYYNFFQQVKESSKKKSLIISVPSFIFYLAGILGNVIRFFGSKTDLSLPNVKILMIDNFFTNQKSVQDLKINYQPLEKAIKDAIGFFESENYF
tara:strand:+ start:731 stop:1696 length:966 start_codon:yes stop_codon:yes gene_type:complete